jgi:hypothetical protein
MSRIPLRYAGWMARDVAFGPGAIMLAVALFASIILWRVKSAPTTPDEVAELIRLIVDQAAMPFVLLATGAIVSGDLTHGYYRSYFSKPVSPAAYYLQRWLIGAAAVALFIPLLAAGIALRTGVFQAPALLFAKVGLLYLMLGGLVLLLSTVTRRDWILALVVTIAQAILHGLHEAGALGFTAEAFYRVLPPLHLASVKTPLPDGTGLAHALAYGLALVLAGLAVIRWRPLGSGGRA